MPVVDSRVPVKSNINFVPPESIMKPSPAIREAVNDPQPAVTGQKMDASAEKSSSHMGKSAENQATPAAKTEQPELPKQPKKKEIPPPQKQPEAGDEETFRQKWLEMIEMVFANVPTLHDPMKHYPVEIRDNTVHVSLKNELQQKDFEMKKSKVLQFLHTHCNEAIDDVISKVDVNMETPKFIMDEKDKMNELSRQNPDFKEFVNILNLRQIE